MGALEGKVVLVTGAGNGIGRDAALIAAREGARVLVNDLGVSLQGDDPGSAGPAEAVAQEIRAAGGEAVANSDSVTSLSAVKAMVEQALDVFGGLHAVINPAGFLRDGMFHKTSPEDWDAVVEVHLRGAFNVCHATIEHFRAQQEGAYVLFSSTSGVYGNIGQTNYAAAKMGVLGLSRVIAMEGANRNVRSNVVIPTAWTRMVASVPIKDEARAKRSELLRKYMRPDQPARLAVALAAAQGVSGQIFGARAEQLQVYSQPRPIQSEVAQDAWTVQSILDVALPAMTPQFTSLDRDLSTPPLPES